MAKLVVVVPSIRDDVQDWTALLDRLKQEPALTGAIFRRVPHGVTWWSRITPDAVAVQVQANINQEWVANGPFDEVILVGHSFGGLIVREAYLRASGADPEFPQTAAWAAAVRRIILFSAINRGINPDDYLSIRLFSWTARFIPPLQKMLGWYVLRGGFFITNLRIRWMRHFAALKNPPVIVQLRGANDRTVDRADSYDMEQFPTGYYIEVPGAVHKDLFRLDTTENPDGRYALLRDAFVHQQPQTAENISVTGADKVVMVVHGIRADNKTWAEQAKGIIQREWPDVLPIALKYKRVTAAQFAFPPIRRRRVRELQDEYAAALARNPRAEFNFIGHSNGTFLLGECLKSMPGMRFNRVVLVGSVLPEEYDWQTIFDRGQVQSLRVDGSCYDWPVGWLCSALRGLGQTTVGTGGFLGFLNNSPAKTEFFWYKGGHGAPLAADNLPALATFAVTGQVVKPEGSVGRSGWFCLVSSILRKLAIPLALLLLAAVVWWDVRVSNSPKQLVEHTAEIVAVLVGVIVILDLI